jgi:ribosomal protein S12 methylthiotransferase
MVTVCLISLGCSKNLVDSEVMLGVISRAGYRLIPDPALARIIVINTCGFIKSARDEAYDTIGRMARYKSRGSLKGLIVAGCLPKLRQEDLIGAAGSARDARLRGVDAFVGPGDIARIGEVVEAVVKSVRARPPLVTIGRNPSYLYDHETPRILATPRHSAYVKIAEGCSNRCTYCLIPSIRGEFRSRRIESIVKESARLAAGGAVELNLIAQDTTQYGADIYGKRSIVPLLERLAAIRQVRWIRLLYTHPAHFDDALIEAMRDMPKVCSYADLPIQHIDEQVLSRMGRKAGAPQIERLIEKLRAQVPAVVLRTSVIVGFPGETEKAFAALLSFINKTRFDRLGAFTYSREAGTPAHAMKGQVSAAEKKRRYDAVMRAQQAISVRNNKRLIGETVEVLLDRQAEDGSFVGRTYGDAPDVDNCVYVQGPGGRTGSLVPVKIIRAFEYDIEGTIDRSALGSKR